MFPARILKARIFIARIFKARNGGDAWGVMHVCSDGQICALDRQCQLPYRPYRHVWRFCDDCGVDVVINFQNIFSALAMDA